MIKIKLQNDIKIEKGFYPQKIEDGYLYLTKENNISLNTLQKLKNLINDDVKYYISEKSKNKLYAYLKRQDEVFGFFEEVLRVKIDNKKIIELIPHNNIQNGDGKNVYGSPNKYTFHTHPNILYKNENVCIGWPSYQDYVSYNNLDKNKECILHIVITKEGMYVIKNNRKIKEIDTRYDEKYPRYCIPEKEAKRYENRINNIGKFKILFVSRKNNSIFSI